MRENRPSGSEGGAGHSALFLPLSMDQAFGLNISSWKQGPGSYSTENSEKPVLRAANRALIETGAYARH